MGKGGLGVRLFSHCVLEKIFSICDTLQKRAWVCNRHEAIHSMGLGCWGSLGRRLWLDRSSLPMSPIPRRACLGRSGRNDSAIASGSSRSILHASSPNLSDWFRRFFYLSLDLMADWVQEDLQPDLTLLLDAPVELGMARAEKRGEADRLDSQDAGFYQRVRDGYLGLAAAEPERFAVSDGSRELEQVQAAIKLEINRLLSNSID